MILSIFSSNPSFGHRDAETTEQGGTMDSGTEMGDAA